MLVRLGCVPDYRAAMRGLVLLVALTGTAFPSAAGELPPASDMWAETTTGVNLRNLPNNASSRRIGLIAPGTPVRVESTDGPWLRITEGARSGWVHGSFVESLPRGARPRNSGEQAVTLASVNLRRGPGFEYPRKRVLVQGEAVRIEEVLDEWLRVADGDSDAGWIHRAYVALRQDEAPPLAAATRIVAASEVLEIPGSPSAVRFLAIVLDDQPVGTAMIRQESASTRLMAAAEDLRGWRFDLAGLQSRTIDSREWFYLDDIYGLSVVLDEARQELYLRADVRSLQTYRSDFQALRYLRPTKSSPGAFLNYEVVGSSGRATDSTINGLVDLNVFGPLGSGVHQAVVNSEDGATSMTRLQTAWIVDLPERRATLTVGDALAGAGDWWQAAHFGGLQLATNNRTQPGFLSSPSLGFEGEAIAPSTFELYLDNALRLREKLPPGPFELRNLPVVNGRGEYQLVVRDALGREVRQEQTFITSSAMLRRGLREYSYSLGALRRGLGRESDRYGRPVLIATERHGLTDRATLDMHTEILENQQTLGVGGTFGLPKIGILELATAASSTQTGSGTLVGFGLTRFYKSTTFGIDVEHAGQDFVRLGAATGDAARRNALQARLALRLRELGSLSLAYTRSELWNDTRTELAALHFNRRLPLGIFMTTSLVHSFGWTDSSEASVTFSRWLGGQRSASATARGGGTGGESVGVSYQQTAPVGSGIGYSIGTETGDGKRLDGALHVKSDFGSLLLSGAQVDSGSAMRTSWKGALAAVGGEVFAARSVEDSFALVRVGGQPGVRVYHENQLVGRTDKRGRILIEHLLAYQRNNLRIEEQDLAVDVSVDHLELEASAFARSGIVVDFPVEQTHAALLIVHGPDGLPLPIGTLLAMRGESRRFPVARFGEVFVTGLGGKTTLIAPWGVGTCQVEVDWPAGDAVLPTLGPLVCEESE